MASSPLLQIEALAGGYGKPDVFDDVSLNVIGGTTTRLLGPPGAGKTAVLMAIAGLVRTRRGSIRFDGEEMRRKRPTDILASGIAYVPQNRQLLGKLSVRENLFAGVWRERERDRARVEADAAGLLARFPLLGANEDRPAGALPSGARQLLAIARALMSRPRLLMLDEPTAALASGVVDDIFALLGELCQTGMTVLVAERESTLAQRCADRTYRLDQGRIAPAIAPV